MSLPKAEEGAILTDLLDARSLDRLWFQPAYVCARSDHPTRSIAARSCDPEHSSRRTSQRRMDQSAFVTSLLTRFSRAAPAGSCERISFSSEDTAEAHATVARLVKSARLPRSFRTAGGFEW